MQFLETGKEIETKNPVIESILALCMYSDTILL